MAPLSELLARGLMILSAWLCASPALAYSLPDGRVVWEFEGTVDRVDGAGGLDIGVCCDPEFGPGAPVSGSLVFGPTLPGYLEVSLELEIGTPSVGGLSAYGEGRAGNALDGRDLAFGSGLLYGIVELLHLEPGFDGGDIDSWAFNLVDDDGDVFPGDPGQWLSMPPSSPPDVEQLETASLDLIFYLWHESCVPNEFCPQIPSSDLGGIYITIERFVEPVPEAPAIAMLLAGALGLLRRVRAPSGA